jgi:thymidine kinase
MAKLYFYYSAMNAGKSTALLQSSYNYQERGMATILFTPSIDTRYERGIIHSRIGLNSKAVSFDSSFHLYDYVASVRTKLENLKCIFVDEAQFLSKEQVSQLTEVVDELSIPVLTYGLRTDFRGEPFPGSLYLLAWADEIIEIKTICHCGRKAIMNIRSDEKGRPVTRGEQVEIGGNEKYSAVCRKHYRAEVKAVC